MTLAPSSAPPPSYPAPRRGHGCLWGCLILLVILALPPVLVGELVREDGMARQVLGFGAVVTGVDGNMFSWMPGGSRHAYDVTLEGPKGEGHLAVTSHQSGLEGWKLDSAILTGPDGRRYDLL